METILGIDVGKFDCHAALLDGDRIARKSFPNTKAGFTQLAAWLHNRKVGELRACMESTGGWSEALATYLIEHGHRVSVVNPSRIKAFGQSELLRTKTDAVDAALIARFCRAMDPEPWTPPAPEVRELQALLRHLANLEETRQEQRNRLEAPLVTEAVRTSLHELIDALDAEIRRIEAAIADLFNNHPKLRRDRDLLTSVPGIGEKTAARIIGEMPDVSTFASSKAAAAYAGLSPEHRQSGVGAKRTRLSKAGNAHLRRALYFPAVVAMRYNPPLRAMADRLALRGKPKMVILGALMRKLVTIAYAILKSGKPFDAALAASRA